MFLHMLESRHIVKVPSSAPAPRNSSLGENLTMLTAYDVFSQFSGIVCKEVSLDLYDSIDLTSHILMALSKKAVNILPICTLDCFECLDRQ